MYKEKINVIGYILMITSLIIGIIVYTLGSRCTETNLAYLSILAFAFFGISIIFYKNYRGYFKKISVTLIITLYYFRMVIIPLITLIVYPEGLSHSMAFLNNSLKTVLMMSYEFFCVMFVIMLISKKKKDKANELDNVPKIEISKTLIIIIAILLLFVFILYIIYPKLKYYVSFLFENSIERKTEINNQFYTIKDSMPRALYWMYTDCFEILYIILPILILIKIYKIKFNENIKFILSIIVIGLFCCVSSPEKVTSVTMALSSIITLIYLYPNKRKNFIPILGICAIGAIFYALMLKANLGNSQSNISNTLQSYFSGPFYVANVFNMNGYGHVGILFNDVLNSIPYITHFFQNVTTSTRLYNIAFYQNMTRNDQILPMVSQSYYYFGMLLAPLLSSIFAGVSIKIEERMREKQYKNLIEMYVLTYTVILISASIITYNMNILIVNLLGTILPIYVLSKINSISIKMKERKKYKNE